jgi:hypothetical protein
MHLKAALTAVLAALVVLAPASGAVARAATTIPVAADPAPADATCSPDPTGPKVVIVVGPMEGNTVNNRSRGDAVAAEAACYTANVVKVYSPNATWTHVKAAAQGASILVYMGHGNGWPSIYTNSLMGDRQDGLGLNKKKADGTYDDYTRKYYGEDYIDGRIGSGIRLAANAIVILNNLCYAPGAAEPGMADPTVAVAKQRVDNFASGFIRAGARAVLADDYSSAQSMIRLIFTTNQPILSAWRTLWGYHGNEIPWTPTRNPAFLSIMDPETWTSGFNRAITVDVDVTTDQVVVGASALSTATNPPDLTAPGAASVVTDGLPVFDDQALSTASGLTLTAGTAVRVDDVVQPAPPGDGSVPPPAVEVQTLDGSTTGWVSGDGLAPRDSAAPQLWSTTGATTITPNFDGSHDRLELWHRLSETASWTATVTDGDGNVLRSQSGTSDLFGADWDGLVDGSPAPPGTYHWTLHAEDAWANPALDVSGDVTVVEEPVPPSALVAFSPLTGTYTKARTLSYQLDFASNVTGLTKGDFRRSGTAGSCSIDAPTGGGAEWFVTVSGCSAGTVTLTLKANSIVDADLATGPATDTAAPTVRIDRTRPVTKAPKTVFLTGVTTSATSMPVRVTWRASDSGGSGLASYDLARSVDGGSFHVVAAGLASPSAELAVVAGHAYRFEVRARDRAGNRGRWSAGPTLRPKLVQQTTGAASWTGAWSTVSDAALAGGSARTATTAGASVSFTFTGRAVAVVMSTDPAYGQVAVYLDGRYKGTIDTGTLSHVDRAAVFARAFAWGSHTLRLDVVGTAGRPDVVVDAFEVIR